MLPKYFHIFVYTPADSFADLMAEILGILWVQPMIKGSSKR